MKVFFYWIESKVPDKQKIVEFNFKLLIANYFNVVVVRASMIARPKNISNSQ